jgi:hypothetical protein
LHVIVHALLQLNEIVGFLVVISITLVLQNIFHNVRK